MAFTGVTFDYAGARVLITGGSGGIGLACAQSYRDAGADVFITGRKSSASDYDSDLAGMTYRQVDVADREALFALAAIGLWQRRNRLARQQTYLDNLGEAA